MTQLIAAIDQGTTSTRCMLFNHTGRAVGIANQRETTVVRNRHTGQPYHNAIVWQDTRTDAICRGLAGNAGQDRFRARTGLPLATYFSGPKIKWLLDHVDGLRPDAERGHAFFGTMIPGWRGN